MTSLFSDRVLLFLVVFGKSLLLEPYPATHHPLDVVVQQLARGLHEAWSGRAVKRNSACNGLLGQQKPLTTYFFKTCLGFRFFGAEERKHAKVCITPYRVQKGY